MGTRRRRPVAPIALVAALLLASLPFIGRAALVEATSWVDAPLDGSIVPLAPVSVVTHAADQVGVVVTSLEVDGKVVRTYGVDPPSRLATGRYLWVPPGEGAYVLTARAQNTAGEWGAPASVTIVVSADLPLPSATPVPQEIPAASGSGAPSPGASPSPGRSAAPTRAPTPSPARSGPPTSGPTASPSLRPAPTPTALSTPLPTAPPTPAPTPTVRPTPPPPCLPPAPTLALPADFFLIFDSAGGNPPLFQWTYDSTPSCFPTTFRLRISTQSNLGSPLYDELSSAGSGGPWEWIPPSPLPFGRACGSTVYYWSVTALASDGSAGGTAPVRQFVICP